MSISRFVASGLVLTLLTPLLSIGEGPQPAVPGPAASAPAGGSENEAARLASLEAQLAERPNQVELLKRYQEEAFSQLNDLNLRARRDPAAEQPSRRLAERVKRVLEGLRPNDAGAKQAVAEMAETVDYHRRQIDARQQTVEQLRQRLHTNPNDVEAVLVYEIKLQSTHHPLNEPQETRSLLDGQKEFLAALKGKATDGKVRETVESLLTGTVPRLEKEVAKSLALRAALVGRDAPPLAEVQAWVNGRPLNGGDLRGKVVLLEFWAVWCGPCIRLFPDLRQWHEKYSAQGLKIVGVTGYHNYKWDEAASRPVEAQGGVPPAQEVQMLEKFVLQHKLPFPIAVEKGRISAAYRVDGIPLTVLIDRRGKVRLVHSGAGPTTRQVDEMISKLLAEDPDGKEGARPRE